MKLKDETDVGIAECREAISAQGMDIFALDKHLAFAWFFQAAHNLEQGCFTRTRFAYHANHAAGGYLEINTFEYFQVTETFVYRLNFDHVTKKVGRNEGQR